VNCSVTTFERREEAPGGLQLVRFNETVALEEAGAPETTEDDPAPGGRS
jgi:hypothetical protein